MSRHHTSLQEGHTSLPPHEVITAAIEFFARRNPIYAAFVEQRSERHVSLRGQGGEEIVIAAATTEQGTRVTGSTYMFEGQVSRFLDGLPPVLAGQSA